MSMVMNVSNLFRVPFWQMYVRRTDENINKYLSSRHKVYLQSHAIWSPTVQIIMFFIGISLSVLFYCVKPSRRNRYDERKVNIKKDEDNKHTVPHKRVSANSSVCTRAPLTRPAGRPCPRARRCLPDVLGVASGRKRAPRRGYLQVHGMMAMAA